MTVFKADSTNDFRQVLDHSFMSTFFRLNKICTCSRPFRRLKIGGCAGAVSSGKNRSNECQGYAEDPVMYPGLPYNSVL